MTTFPDIETELVAMLKTASGVDVATLVPADRPEEFVRAWVTGGSAEQRVYERPTVTYQAWAADSVRAAEIAAACRDELLRRFGAPAEITRPYLDPDPDTGIPRYSGSIRVRNRAL